MDTKQATHIYEDTFFIIPRYIRKLPGLTLAYLDVYETIFQFWNKNKDCFLGENALCERTGYKRAIIYRALRFFEQHNELKRINIKGQRYLVKPEKSIETDCTEDVQSSTTVDSDVYNRRLLTSTPVDHNIKKGNKENNLKDLVSSPPSSSKNFEYPDTLYPIPKPERPENSDKTISLEKIQYDNPHSIPPDLIQEWQQIRKAKRAPITLTAWNRLNKELAKFSGNKIEAFEEMVSRGWSTFKCDWMISAVKKPNSRQINYNATNW